MTEQRIGIYAGSYDPFTYGHLSVVRGALKVFDHVLIAVGTNPKKKGLFVAEERVDMIREYLEHAHADEPDVYKSSDNAPKCSVMCFDGLLIDFARRKRWTTEELAGRCAIVRGLRAVSDFEQEMAIADANRRQCEDIQTVFIPAEANDAFVSSSTVKELALYDSSDLSYYVSHTVAKRLKEALRS